MPNDLAIPSPAGSLSHRQRLHPARRHRRPGRQSRRAVFHLLHRHHPQRQHAGSLLPQRHAVLRLDRTPSGLSLPAIKSYHVSGLPGRAGGPETTPRPTVKQHLASLRMLFDWLITGQVIEANPAAAVRAAKHVVKKGKTPVLKADEARELLDSIPLKIGPEPKEGEPDNRPPSLIGLRDRALIAVMVFSFARISAALGMKVEDYYTEGRRAWFRLHEKGGKRHEVPAHHNAEDYLDAYIAAAGIAGEKKTPLFRSIDRHRQLTDRPMHRIDAWRMIKRRAQAIGLPEEICNHTFRATGITAYLENGGTIEHAQQIANHESPNADRGFHRLLKYLMFA